MKWKSMLLTAALMATVFVVPTHAMDYTVDAPSAGDFGTPTSDEAIYVNTPAANVGRSKNAALIPLGFGTPTSYLPGSSEPLTPNLTGGMVTPIYPECDGTGSYPGTSTPTVTLPTTAYTTVTSDLYYSGGHIATLKIPTLGLTVKVYQGTDSAQLAKGAGHFPGTSIWDGNIAVAAHNRGVNNHFGRVHTLREGDKITLTTKLGTRTYAVTDVYQVSENDSSMLAETSGNAITLITCVRDQKELRWCVRAEQI